LREPLCDRLLGALRARPAFGEGYKSISKIWCYTWIGSTARLLVCLFCAILCVPAFSLDRDRSIGQFYYTFWSEKDNAPSQINALAQTEDGYLWIGSARGLFRFDGLKFEEYKPQHGVEPPSHNIHSLMATPDGGLWIAFEPTGLAFLKDGSLTVFTKRGELPDSPVLCFARDHEGRIWAGTETGLAILQGARWIPVGRDWNLTPEMIRYLLVDHEGTLWVASVKTIAFLKPGSKTFQLGGPIGSGVTTLAQAKDGRVWLADDGSWQVRPVPTAGHDSYAEGPSVAEEGLRDLLFDRDGALWITRMDSGIVRIRHPEELGNRKYGSKDPELESFGAKDGFTPGFAYDLLEDREGNIWVGCSNGLLRFRNNQVVPAHLRERYQKVTLLAGREGDLWVGTIDDRPLQHIRGESVASERVGGQVSSVLRAANGDVWWGTRSGIWRQRGRKFDFFPLPKEATPDWIYEIIPGEDDASLWIKLGDVGFVHFKRGVWNLHDWPRGVPSAGGTFRYGPSASYQDSSGRVWLGYTSGQVCLLDGKRVTVFSKNDGLDLGRIKVIRGLRQHIWVGGELGLMFFSKGRFLRVTGADGEPFGAISGIIETPDGGLWLNEMTGIVQIPAEEIRQFVADPNHSVNYRRFDYQDGLPGMAQMSFTNSTAVRTSDGRLWFATDNGLAWIDPTHLVKNVVPPPVSILSIGSERGRKPMANAIKFAAGTQNVEIDYAGLSLSIPERVEFRYKLEGMDTDWQNVGTRRQAYYSNLGPGSYRFRVIARNNDGVWNDTGALIDFSIAPTYYQTAWFRVLCVVAFLTLLWAAYQLRVRQLRNEERKFREAVETMPALAFIAKPDGQPIFVNRRWIEYTRLTEEQALGWGWQAVVHPEDLSRVLRTWQESLTSGNTLEYEARLLRGTNGDFRWFQTRAVPVRDKRRKIVKWYGVINDIEDRKRAEQLQADLAHVNRVSTMDELTASLAHEIRQPISAATTNAQISLWLLERDQLEIQELREATSAVLQSVKRAGDIIDRVRLLYQRGCTQLELVDVNEVIAEMLILLRNEANRHSVTMRTDLADGVRKVMADRVQLQQVLMNLMLNGIEAMRDNGGELSINSQLSEGGNLLISVTDNGIGLPAERPDQIFNAFFTTKPQGTGLGLAITRAIVESHGGRVWATANPGRGTTFHFTLPIRTAVSA
jgi:PAS domain S-box-containing protein